MSIKVEEILEQLGYEADILMPSYILMPRTYTPGLGWLAGWHYPSEMVAQGCCRDCVINEISCSSFSFFAAIC